MTASVVEQVKSTIHYSQNGDNWIDLHNIPLKEWRDKKIYDWRKLDAWVEVPFKYKGLEDVMLVKFDHIASNNQNYIVLSYEACKNIITTTNLMAVMISKLMNRVPVRNPILIRYFEHGFYQAQDYTCGSKRNIKLKCDNCSIEKEMKIQTLNWGGFRCPRCSNTISFPERFTGALLDEMGFKYETQKRFEGVNYRFDFYIPRLKLIIEVHGSQHFNDKWISRKEVVSNDNDKRKFIKFELGLNYAAIDISVSEPYYAWSMLEQNDFLKSYMKNIEYYKVIDKCHNSNVDEELKNIVEDYESGMTVFELCDKYERAYTTLKQKLKVYGVYDSERDIVKTRHTRKVICITTGKKYNSITNAQKETGVTGISECVRGKQKSAGKTSDGRKRVWQFLSDYEQEQNQLKGAN